MTDARRHPYKWEEMLPEEFFAEFARSPVAYVAGGAVEDHGPQNALGVDPLTANAVCLAAAERSGGIVHPPIYLAPPCLPPLSRAELRVTDKELYKPSLWVSRELCEAYIVELLESLSDFGFKAAFFIAGHYPLQVVADELLKGRGDRIGAMRWWGGGIYGIAEQVMPEARTERELFGHGTMWETSNMRAVGEHLVEVERVTKVRTSAFPWRTQLDKESDEVLARALEANADFGNRFYAAAGEYLAARAREMAG
jgi:creatinine amidohydrolase/Fe(II)-dependent formamide hydrolase-like protein